MPMVFILGLKHRKPSIEAKGTSSHPSSLITEQVGDGSSHIIRLPNPPEWVGIVKVFAHLIGHLRNAVT